MKLNIKKAFKLIMILLVLGSAYGVYLKISSLPKRIIYKPCEPLPVVDGFVTVNELESGITLKLPNFARFSRSRAKGLGCQNVRSFSVDYIWYEKKLIPAYRYNKRVRDGFHIKGQYFPVRIYFKRAWANNKNPLPFKNKDAWHYEPAIPHEKFPLVSYPRYYWDDPINPSKSSLKSAKSSHNWGIRDTKYKQVGTGKPFDSFCSIAPLDPSDPSSRVKGDFADYGDSKCRGGVSASKGNKGIYFMVDVWAYKIPEPTAVKEINLIYDALVEELQTFIKE